MQQHHDSQAAVITGAASGMGRATALALAEHGWEVVALDIAGGTIPAGGRDIEILEADVTDRASVKAVLDTYVGQTGHQIQALANVAGIYPPSTLDDFTEYSFRQIFDVNVLGVLNVTAEAVSHMSDGGYVVNFASVDAFTVSPGQLLYGASKAAVVMLTKELALELAERNIRVNAIAPGWVRTPGNDKTGRMEGAAKSIPLQRVAEPEEIARWVTLLTSSDASFMTGETIVLSGGDVMR